MPYWICCNSCFQSPSPDRKLAVTSCGHIICQVCFKKGKPGDCLICNTKCQVSPLSDKSSSEVKDLFSDINTVSTKHLRDVSQVILFQARQQKRLLSHYQQRNDKLEEAFVKMKQEMQQMSKKMNEQSAYIGKLERSLQYSSAKSLSLSQISHSSHASNGQQAVLQIPYNSPMSLSRHTSSSHLGETVQDELNLFRKPDPVPRLSLISPPQDGRMGTIAQRAASQSLLVKNSTRSATVSRFQGLPVTPDTAYGRSSGWDSPIFRPPFVYRHSSMSSLVCTPP